MIYEELNPSLILTDVEAADYADVMQQLGGALVREGYAKESYVAALIAREQEFPTGLDVDGVGVAIPHTDASHVNQAGVAIAVLKTPVTFVQMGTDDDKVAVQLVFMLSVIDPNRHIDKLKRILEMIQDTALLGRILQSKTAEDIMKLIAEKERTL